MLCCRGTGLPEDEAGGDAGMRGVAPAEHETRKAWVVSNEERD
jgi:hypothetical protein